MQRLYLFSRHVIFVVLQIQVTLDPLGVLNSQKVAVTLCIIYFVYFGLIILLITICAEGHGVFTFNFHTEIQSIFA